jgi:hypothetical protein
MKLCRNCRNLKEDDEFYRHKLTKDGLWSECKKCNIRRATIWNNKNLDRKRKNGRLDWARHREKRVLELKKCWNKRDFGGLRNFILKRDKYKCVKCGMTREKHFIEWEVDINVDHINRNRKENTLDNLQTICLKCHGAKHAHEQETRF